ncbi:DUF305 domain-containing protein [Herbidospora sp. NEAU-GS84]|uniref:DUF305 domain-containing protein n=1 Tax=Herbidospora solisilvae TaxID=2696284 RepID=A0A7C9JEE0_9ACTN|nr:DUF305 domain-containing protein [Herbidospora solisilvae]NAS24501.1 DUF305 domain-containing protein [Herbidospora solisilvae]
MNTHHISRRRVSLAAATAALAIGITACGGGEPSGTTHTTGTTSAQSPAAVVATASKTPMDHNAADVAFAQGMIPHHRQAVAMSELAATRAASAEVKELATEISEAQQPEIDTMSGWLTMWGQPVPQDMPGMDHSGHEGMPGMMTPEEMNDLAGSSGKAFDTAFLEMMIKHHEGAVTMARAELSAGFYPPAKSMAETIIATQSAEIAHMKELLGSM